VRDILVEVLEGGEKVLGCQQPAGFNFMKNTATYRSTLSSLLTGPRACLARKRKRIATLWVFFNFTSELNALCLEEAPRYTLQFYSEIEFTDPKEPLLGGVKIALISILL
jgi:hypothetical protein